jgi:hypothetical protein
MAKSGTLRQAPRVGENRQMTMRFTFRARAVARLLVVLGAALVVSATAVSWAQTAPTTLPAVTVYKSATCGCCEKWVEHMKVSGFKVTAVDVDDIEVPMKTYGVPASAASCHTAVMGGYVVEGHVPADLVKKMLKEKPAITGIAAPGMPVGSPGMEVPGAKAAAYDVVSFDKLGKTALYAKR